MSNACFQFRDEIRAVGLLPPESIVPDKLHRFPGVDKGPSNRAGWCILFADGLGGVFGDWAAGFRHVWQADRSRDWTRYERAQLARRVQAAQQQAGLERQRQQAIAAERAEKIWAAAAAAPEGHPYLLAKNTEPGNARLHAGCLMLSVVSFQGALTSLQFIAPDGDKRLLTGGRKRGCFIVASGAKKSVPFVIICEGWATGCTLAEGHPTAAVLAAIDAGNMTPVAVGARCQWPSAEIVIAGDDDRQTPGNPGVTCANEAARAAGALVALPPWPPGAPESLTDFNDLAQWLAGGGL